MFRVGAHVHYLRSTDELVFAQIVGPSPYGDIFRTMTYMHIGNPLTHYKAPLTRLTELHYRTPSPVSPPSPSQVVHQAWPS